MRREHDFETRYRAGDVGEFHAVIAMAVDLYGDSYQEFLKLPRERRETYKDQARIELMQRNR